MDTSIAIWSSFRSFPTSSPPFTAWSCYWIAVSNLHLWQHCLGIQDREVLLTSQPGELCSLLVLAFFHLQKLHQVLLKLQLNRLNRLQQILDYKLHLVAVRKLLSQKELQLDSFRRRHRVSRCSALRLWLLLVLYPYTVCESLPFSLFWLATCPSDQRIVQHCRVWAINPTSCRKSIVLVVLTGNRV